MNGISMPIERLYPAVSFPVSRGTQMISPMILWDHGQDYTAGEYDEKATNISCERKIMLNISDEDSAYMAGHIIDGNKTTMSMHGESFYQLLNIFRAMFTAGNFLLAFRPRYYNCYDTLRTFRGDGY